MRALISLFILTAMLMAQAARPAPGDLLEPAASSIPLPKVSGRIDDFGVDTAGARLFVAALGNNTLEVIDLKANRRLKSIPGFGEPQGVQVVPQFNRVYVANGSANRVDVLDATSLERIRSIEGLQDADNIRYDAAAQKIYVGYEKGALKILDASTSEASGDI